MSKLKKAKIYDPDRTSDNFYVQFNPNTLDYTIGTNKRARKGVSARGDTSTAEEKQAQADPTGRSSESVLSVKLFYHTYTNETTYSDVREDVNRIRAFLRQTGDDGSVSSRRIAFAWGTITQIGVLDSIQVSYQMFAADGTPVQAEVSIAIRGNDPDVKAAAKNRSMSIEYQSDIKAEWRKRGGQLPGGVEWLFM